MQSFSNRTTSAASSLRPLDYESAATVSASSPGFAYAGMGLSLLVGITALVGAIRTQHFFHAQMCWIAAIVWSYVVYVWLCCLIARWREYHPAVGLLGLGVISGLVIPFLPVDEGPTVRRRAFEWIGVPHIAILFGLWVLVSAAFWNSYTAGWTLDNLYIIKYDTRTQADSWNDKPGVALTEGPGVRQYFMQDYWWPKGISGLYRPLTAITYWLNWTALGSGDDPRGFHVVNTIAHWINASLLYALAYVLTRRWPIAMLAASLFAVHPITTESVTNLIGRADQFAAIAVLGGVLVWRWGTQLSGLRILWGFFAVMLITAFGVFSKESAIALTLVLLIYDLVYRWNPLPAKWFGLLLLALLPPAIAGSSAVTGRWSTLEFATAARFGFVLFIYIIAAAQHVALQRAEDHSLRWLSLGISLGLSILASLFIPASGVALIVVLALYELFFGPWTRDAFPAFWEIRWAALAYTAGFVVLLFGALGLGLLLWLGDHRLIQQQFAEPIALFLKNLHLAAAQTPLGFDYARAGILVGIGAAAWWWALTRSTLQRGISLGLIVLLAAAGLMVINIENAAASQPAISAWTPTKWPAIGLAICASAVLVAGVASLMLSRGPQPKIRPVLLMLPAVLTAAAAASFFVFWAGFLLMATVGLIELLTLRAAPRILQQSTLWRDLLRRFVVGYYLLLPPVIAFFIVRFWIFNVQSSPPEEPFLDNPLRGGPFDPLPFWQSRMTAVKVMGKLIYLLFYPRYLSCDYSHDQIPFFTWNLLAWENIKAIVALLFIVGMIVLACLNFRRNKPLFFFIMFFFATLLPTSNLIKLIGSIMAERFMYLPLVGFAGMIAILLDMLFRRASVWLGNVGAPGRLARMAPYTALLAIVLPLLVTRTYARNPDWASDITLWESAIKVSPRSFRCYQSLAYAYFEKLSEAPSRIDKVIEIAENARPIVDPLPHDRNSSRLYLHLGMYYNAKGELVSATNPDGSKVVTSEARQYFLKALEALQYGVEVDQAFNETNRRRHIERGDPPERIFDAGLTPLYATIGLSYQRVGKFREAFAAYQYQRQLDPERPEPYFRLAMLHFDYGSVDEAAVSLIQALMLDPKHTELWQTLAVVYSRYGAEANGAMTMSPEGLRLNLEHPLPRRHFIGAYRGLIRVFRMANRPALAEATRRAAVHGHGMPAMFFDDMMIEPVPRVTPDGLTWEPRKASP